MIAPPLVECVRSSNHIDVIHQPRPEEPTAGRRLEGRPRARPCQWPSFETPCCARLLRMRSVGSNSILPIATLDISMRHQHRQRGVGQDVTGGAAEYHLAQAALRVGAFYDEIAASQLRMIEDRLTGRASGRCDGDASCRHTVAAQGNA